MQEEIVSKVGQFLERARDNFPRLYFCSDEELIELTAVSRSPSLWLPFVRRCFAGVQDLRFELSADVAAFALSKDNRINGNFYLFIINNNVV